MARNFREKEPYAFTSNAFSLSLPYGKIGALAGHFRTLDSVIKLARESDSLEDALTILEWHLTRPPLSHFVGPQVEGVLSALRRKGVEGGSEAEEERDAEWTKELEKIAAEDVSIPSCPEDVSQLVSDVDRLDERTRDLEELLQALVLDSEPTEDPECEAQRDIGIWDDARSVSDNGRSWKWLDAVRKECGRWNLPSEAESRIRTLARKLPPEKANNLNARDWVAAQVRIGEKK